MSDHNEAKAREILEKIDRDRLRSDIHPAQARDEHIGAIANALAEATEDLSRKFEDARGRIEELERDFAKLQSPEGVHINMLSGKIAKISMMLCAHTHGEDAVREFRAKDARIAELERELGRDDEDLPDVKPMSKEAYEECMRLASDYEDRRAFEVPAVAARIAELTAAIKPFANYAEKCFHVHPHDSVEIFRFPAIGVPIAVVTFGDLRTARAVLEGKSE